jgi:two-component system alkaline phosphatase synthesis response regulator PhoP
MNKARVAEAVRGTIKLKRYKVLADEPNVSAWGNYKVFEYAIIIGMAASEMKNVLIVEDDQFLLSLLKNRIQRESINVLTAKDGEEALKILKSVKPDLLLLDIILPGKSGFEVLEEMKSDPQLQNAPVMIISNLGQEGDIERGRELGAVEYFVKARTSIDELINKVKEFLK